MADSTILGLDDGAPAQLTDALTVQRGTINDRAVRLALSDVDALIGGAAGLTYNSVSPGAGGEVGPVAGNIYDVTIPASGATFTLPATSDSADRITVRCAADSATDELVIQNVLGAGAVEWSRVFIGGEVVSFASNGANYYVENDGRIPCKTFLGVNTSSSTNTAGVAKQVVCDDAIIDVGGCADATAGEIVVRRDNYWIVLGSCKANVAVTDGQYYSGQVRKDGAQISLGFIIPGGTTSSSSYQAHILNSASATNRFELWMASQEANKGYGADDTRVFLAGVEQLL